MKFGGEATSPGEGSEAGREPSGAEPEPSGPGSPNAVELLWADFRTAVDALTPFGRSTEAARTSMGRAAAFYPAVGLLIGLTVEALDWILRTVLSQEIASVLLVGMLALLSAGRQLDGFANTADGLIGFRGREWALATMHDRRVGSPGAAAIFFLLILKVRSLDLISGPVRFAGLVLAPLIGRWALVALAHGARGVGSAGGGGAYDPALTPRELMLASLFGTIVVLAVAGSLGFLVLGVAAGATVGMRVYFDHRLGGVTGQSLDAGAEILETLALILFALAS